MRLSNVRKSMWRMSWLALACVGLNAGCKTAMETGYQPRSLSASPAQRRGYYASPFSPEAEAAAKDKGTDQRGARPSFGGM